LTSDVKYRTGHIFSTKRSDVVGKLPVSRTFRNVRERMTSIYSCNQQASEPID